MLAALLVVLLHVAVPEAVAGEDLPTTGRIHIVVPGAVGQPVGPVYVAAVPEVSPWHEPAEETVVEDPDGVEWSLPPGNYRLVAAAPGHAVFYGPPIALAAGAVRTERLRLDQLVPVEGRVEDRAGEPVTGARVSHLRSLIFDFPGRLADRGEELLAETFQTTSDDEGRFRIHLHPSAGQPLAVQADGYSPRFFPDVRLAGAAEDLQPVVLDLGAELRVRWSGDPEAAGGLDRLQVVPRQGSPSGLDLAGVLSVWARRLEGEAQRWSALPPGKYALWLKGPRAGAHRVLPQEVASFELAPGQAREIAIALPRRPTPEGEGGSTSVKSLKILLPELPSAELESLKTTIWSQGARSATGAAPIVVSGGTLVTLAGGCVAGANAVLTTAEWIAIAGPVAVDRCGEAERVVLRPRGAVAATLLPPPGISLPLSGEISVSPCDSAPEDPLGWRATVPFLTDETGKLEASVPAGCVDLTVRAGDLAPLDFRGLTLETARIRPLGPQRLALGAALLVRVLSSGDGRPLAGVTLGAHESDRADRILSAAAGGDAAALLDGAVVTGEDGWARLYGVPATDVTLLLLGPGRRFPYPAAHLALHPGEERVLDALELPPPATLTVEVEVSPELEREDVEIVEVYLQGQGLIAGLGLSRDVGEDGTARFEEVPPGSWRALGIVRLPEQGRQVPAGEAHFEVASGVDETVSLPLSSPIFRGRVTYQGVPVEGQLALRPIEPRDRRGFTTELDSEGRFALPLEGPGLYRGTVWERERRLEDVVVPRIWFDRPGEEVEIRLPEGVLAGVVTDDRGRPQGGARVEARTAQTEASGEDHGDSVVHVRRSARTDRAGRFSFDALPPGAWTLKAEAGELESGPLAVDLQASERIEDVELVIGEAEAFGGTVVDPTGHPVVGARLILTPQPGLVGGLQEPIGAETGAEGTFSGRSPFVGTVANIQVMSPDGTVGATRMEMGGDMLLQLPDPGSLVRLSAPCPAGPGTLASSLMFVAADGAYVSPAVVSYGEAQKTSRCRLVWALPALAAGHWRLVSARTFNELLALQTGAGWSLDAVEVFESAPGRLKDLVVEEPSDRQGTPGGDDGP